jgi:hypothetical protein
MLSSPPTPITTNVANATKDIAALFGELYLPVTLALLCLRPRPLEAATEPARVEMAFKLHDLLNIKGVDPNLASEPWAQPGAVYTVDGGYTGRWQFLDVRQWIGLLRFVSQYPPK